MYSNHIIRRLEMPLRKSKTKAGTLIEDLVEKGAAALGRATHKDNRKTMTKDIEEGMPTVSVYAAKAVGSALGKATHKMHFKVGGSGGRKKKKKKKR